MYNSKLMEMFEQVDNAGFLRGADATGVFTLDNAEQSRIQIKVENNVITDAKFKTFGCIASIVATSVATKLIVGKTLEEARDLSVDELAQNFENIKVDMTHAYALAKKAIADAVLDYQEKARKAMVKLLKENGDPIPDDLKKPLK